jgi:hypothetical protein
LGGKTGAVGLWLIHLDVLSQGIADFGSKVLHDKTSARFSIYLAKHQRTEMRPSNRGDGKEARCPRQMQLPTSALFLGQLSGVGRCVAS